MCYESLTDGDAVQRPMAELLRTELSSAVKDGAVTAAVVLAVLLADGVGALLVAGATVGAFVLGLALHQAVLVAGAALLRWRTPGLTESSDVGADRPESV